MEKRQFICSGHIPECLSEEPFLYVEKGLFLKQGKLGPIIWVKSKIAAREPPLEIGLQNSTVTHSLCACDTHLRFSLMLQEDLIGRRRGEIDMNSVILENILKRAPECQRDSSCIHPYKKRDLCLVTDSVNGVLFVAPNKDSRPCERMLHFGLAYICNCPVRKEIYAKYRI